MKIELTVYNLFIYFIIIIKIVFLGCSVTAKYYEAKGLDKKKENVEFVKTLEYWRERTEFIFIASMSFLLFYTFNPWHTKPPVIDKEARLLFYLYGFIILFTADWGLFFKESKWVIYFQQVMGKTDFSVQSQDNNKVTLGQPVWGDAGSSSSSDSNYYANKVSTGNTVARQTAVEVQQNSNTNVVNDKYI